MMALTGFRILYPCLNPTTDWIEICTKTSSYQSASEWHHHVVVPVLQQGDRHATAQVMIIWAANQDSTPAMRSAASEAAVSAEAAALVLSASDETAAARRAVAQICAVLAGSTPNMALLQLLLDLVEIPFIKQVLQWLSTCADETYTAQAMALPCLPAMTKC